MLNILVSKMRERVSIAFSLFFIVLTPSFLFAEEGNIGILSDVRILGDLLIPTIGKNFDLQPFITRTSFKDLSSVDCSLTNAHNKIRNEFEVDGESYICSYKYESSLSDRLRLSANISGVHTGEGIFDSSITAWHEFFGFPNGHRNGSSNNQHQVRGSQEDGDNFNLDKEGIGLIDPQIYLSYLLGGVESDGALYLNAGLSIPLQLSQFSTKTPNFLLGLNYSKKFLNSTFGMGSDLSIRTDLSDLGINYNPISVGAYASWVYGLSDSFSFVSSTFAQTPGITDIESYPKALWYVDIGFRTDLFFDTPFEILIRENLYTARSTADISLILRVLSF